jgi:hypothetical protein
MPEQKPEQNFANHVRRPEGGFRIVLLVLLATLIGACVNLYQSIGDHQRLYSASLILVLSGCMPVVLAGARVFALKAQDRAIRAEENLRHYVLTGKLLDPRLTLQQIAALRFASDEEFVPLARQAAERNMEPNDIKRAVKNWRADFHRV